MGKMSKVGLSLLSAFILGACGGESMEAVEEQVLNLAEDADIDSMDTTVPTDGVSFNTMNNVFEGLLGYDLEGTLIPTGASDFPEESDDKLVYTFVIREDANWSNGDPVTAADYVFAWQKIVDPVNAAGYAYLFDGIVKNATAIINSEMDKSELGVRAIDEKTLEVTLEQPIPYFLDLLAMPFYFPQNQEYVDEQGDQYAQDSEHLLYNGPFQLDDWTAAQGGSWSYVKNDDYWDEEAVQLDRINWQVLKETSTGINLYDSGELDRTELTGSYVQQYQDNAELKTRFQSTIYYLELNQAVPELANENIRKAFTMAIDNESFTKNVLQDGSEAIYGHVPSGLSKNPVTGADFREDAGDVTAYDLEAAQAAWAQGLEELGTDTIALELITSDTEDSKVLSEYVQSQLQTNLPGLVITVQQLPANSRLSKVKAGEYQMATATWGADFADPINYLERFDTDINRANYSYADVDALIDQSREQYADAEARWETLMEVEQVALGEHYAHIPVYQAAEVYLEKDYVKDTFRPMFGSDSYKYAYLEEGAK